MSLLVTCVLEPIAGVEEAEVVNVLDIALTEIKTRIQSLYKEMSIECFSLGFGNGRDFRQAIEGGSDTL